MFGLVGKRERLNPPESTASAGTGEAVPPKSLQQRIALPANALGTTVVIDEDEQNIYVRKEAQSQMDAAVHSALQRAQRLASRDGRIHIQYLDGNAFGQVRNRFYRYTGAQNRKTAADMEPAVYAILDKATRMGTTDIHVYVYRELTDIFFRIDGSLVHTERTTREWGQSWINVMYTTFADIKERQLVEERQQSGAVREGAKLPEGLHGVRLERGPSDTGQYMVIRLLYDITDLLEGGVEKRLEGLGYHTNHVAALRRVRQRPSGVTIICGMVNSGKSTTLQQWLTASARERPDQAFFTIEDPPEYPMEGVIQIPVPVAAYADPNRTTTENRQEAWRRTIASTVRSDMNNLMIGELRDQETTEAALDVGRTGYRVLATLHANTAWEGIERLAFLVSSQEGGSAAVQGAMMRIANKNLIRALVYQRLMPKLCPSCAVPWQHGGRECVDSEVAQQVNRAIANGMLAPNDGGARIHARNPQGCEQCSYRGERGRTVAAEVLETTPQLMDVLRRDGTPAAEAQWRKDPATVTAHRHAREKVAAGLIDPHAAMDAVGPLDDEDEWIALDEADQAQLRRVAN